MHADPFALLLIYIWLHLYTPLCSCTFILFIIVLYCCYSAYLLYHIAFIMISCFYEQYMCVLDWSFLWNRLISVLLGDWCFTDSNSVRFICTGFLPCAMKKKTRILFYSCSTSWKVGWKSSLVIGFQSNLKLFFCTPACCNTIAQASDFLTNSSCKNPPKDSAMEF